MGSVTTFEFKFRQNSNWVFSLSFAMVAVVALLLLLLPGTQNSTVRAENVWTQVSDTAFSTQAQGIPELYKIGSDVYFFDRFIPGFADEIYRFDGTNITNITDGEFASGYVFNSMTTAGDTLFVAADSNVGDPELWSYNPASGWMNGTDILPAGIDELIGISRIGTGTSSFDTDIFLYAKNAGGDSLVYTSNMGVWTETLDNSTIEGLDIDTSEFKQVVNEGEDIALLLRADIGDVVLKFDFSTTTWTLELTTPDFGLGEIVLYRGEVYANVANGLGAMAIEKTTVTGQVLVGEDYLGDTNNILLNMSVVDGVLFVVSGNTNFSKLYRLDGNSFTELSDFVGRNTGSPTLGWGGPIVSYGGDLLIVAGGLGEGPFEDEL